MTAAMPHARPGRRIAGRAQDADRLDPYRAREKPRDPTVCRQCGAVYHAGRWRWGTVPDKARPALCPACRRIHDKLPAGIVSLHGPLAPPRLAEMLALARHQEQAERNEHPLNRIIDAVETAEVLTISTTDIHLARRIGEAVKRAFGGELRSDFDGNSYFVRVDWRPGA